MIPYPHQEAGIQSCLNYLQSDNNSPGIFVGPTAVGKSLIISSVAQRWGKPCLVLQPSKELLEQNLGKLRMLGGDAAVYSASLSQKEIDELTYATLKSIKNEDAITLLKKYGVSTVFIDECDDSYSPEKGSEFMLFINKLKPKKTIGFTATPFRLKNTMTGSKINMLPRMRPSFFKHFIHVIQVQELVAKDYWAKLEYNVHNFNEAGLLLNSTGADYTGESVQKALEVNGVNNAMYRRVKQLLKQGSKSILVFMDGLETAKKMAELFGSDAGYLGSDLTPKQRTKVIEDFKSCKLKILVNHRILTVGFDHPPLENILLGFPTKSLRLWYQIVGRGTRKYLGKVKCTIDDFCGNFNRFGRVEDLNMDFIPGWGWGFFSKDTLVTNTLIDGLRVTKDDIRAELAGETLPFSDKIFFGNYPGQRLRDLSISYLRYLVEECNFYDPKKIKFMERVHAMLDYYEQQSGHLESFT